MKKLYFNSKEKEFYFVTKRPKSILIEWAENKQPSTWNSDGEVIEWHTLDFNVRWKKLIVSTCGKNKNHCLREYDEDNIWLYPFQEGLPFYLKPATDEDINTEIEYHKSSEVSCKYYENLKIY